MYSSVNCDIVGACVTTAPLKHRTFPFLQSLPFTPARGRHCSDFYHRFILIVLELHRNGIKQYVTFWDCLISLSIMPLRFIQIIALISSSFLFVAEWYSLVWIHQSLSIQASRDICIGPSFWLLETKLLSTFLYKSLCEHIYSFLLEWNSWV